MKKFPKYHDLRWGTKCGSFWKKIPIFSFPNHLGHRNYVKHKYVL